MTHDLAIVPLGPGDLIDRAVRFYRRFFWSLVLIASPPVVVGTIVSVAWHIAAREIFATGDRYSFEYFFYYLFLWLGTLSIWFIETIATLVVMGGASRNFVSHILFGEPITFRATYAGVRQRIGGLVAASVIIATVLGFVGVLIFQIGGTIVLLAITLVISALEFIPALAFLLSLLIGIAGAGGCIWLFFLVASRLAYVPQVMLVEGQSVVAAISRSVSLARGNVRRLAALFVFTSVAAYSALALLYVPLIWYAQANGVQLSFGADPVPAWYQIVSNVIWQISFIIMSPVWMIGLCLLYVDERVRHEGYDIELMAARRLGEIPDVPDTYINPLKPAISTAAPPAADRGLTMLNIK